jgi:hypothetical protein
MLDMQSAIGWDIRVASGRRMVTMSAYGQAKPHLAFCHHLVLSNEMSQQRIDAYASYSLAKTSICGTPAGQ